MECRIDSGGTELVGHLARPVVAREQALPTMVLAHGFPAGRAGSAAAAKTYPELASRLSAGTGWAVLTFSFRGAGPSPGNFSLRGWLADLDAVVDHVVEEGAASVWVTGSSIGGALAILAAAADPRVRGIVTLAAPATFATWFPHPRRLLDHARQVGVIASPDFPPDAEAWCREPVELRPIDAMANVPPRPVMIIHGTDDDVVPLADARALAAAAGDAELHVLAGADHRLRHDPRTIAMINGWMERQVVT